MDMMNKIKLKTTPSLAMIEQAIQKTAVHTNFLRDKFWQVILFKYDASRQQIIVKNFSQNVTRIIRIGYIKGLRFVPSTVHRAQKKSVLRKSEMLHPTLLSSMDLFKMKVNSDVVAITTSLQITLQAIRDIMFCNCDVTCT